MTELTSMPVTVADNGYFRGRASTKNSREATLPSTSDSSQASTPNTDLTTTTLPDATMPVTFTLTSTKMASQQPTIPFDPTSPEPQMNANGDGVVTLTSSTLKESRARIVNSEKITFGEEGKGPGKFSFARGVAVSSYNEIVVADPGNRRVQVFSMKGAFLRLFPTVVPDVNGQAMRTCDVATDGKGYVWAVGSNVDSNRRHGYLVQYSRQGKPELNANHVLRNIYNYPPSVAFDAANNKVIVAAYTDIYVFSPNGSSYTSFKSFKNRAVFFITSDEGHIFVTEANKSKVQVYNHTGRRLFMFGSEGKGKGKLNSPHDICTDNSGHIIIANWLNHCVDMFTSRGEFVRTIAEIQSPWGVAVGPHGQMVVTSYDYTVHVTIFPRHMVYP
ncbi:tripartite motif-containing protein 3-like [Branchiostoma lanceolatum]|uniref:tripartite motif-containing protein 3-like n=1 Tax=Branchiostoma lanceolatum TaxID=7740 RepID=UPI003452FB42